MSKIITSLDKNTLPALRASIDAALNKIAAEYGLDSLVIGSMTYTPDGGEVSCKLVGSVKATANPKVIATNLRLSKELGYSDNIVGQTLENRGDRFEVIGFDSSKRKFPIKAKRLSDGKLVCFPNPERGLLFDNKAITFKSPFSDYDFSNTVVK